MQVVHEIGPRPFVTERHYVHQGQLHIWHSREHRRGLHHLPTARAPVDWRPERLNVWIGASFSVGSTFFALSSALALAPDAANELGLTTTQINQGYFIGSIFFTLAAYLQLFQAANPSRLPDGAPPPTHLTRFGWHPREIGWLSCLLQFIGTVFFNVNTYLGIHPSGHWLRDEITIWGPDLLGSILFLASGYLAFAEASHGYWSWRPKTLSWWIVTINLGGCVAFMISAIYAFTPRSGSVAAMVQDATAWTLIGALCFLTGAVLMLVEGAAKRLEKQRRTQG